MIEKIKSIAISKGGRCLSNHYKNNHSLLEFSCHLNHRWSTNWKNINKGSWCPECAIIKVRGSNNPRADTIENMKKIANDRYGKCLSLEYLGAHKKLTWQCYLGHEWQAKPYSIKNGTWCPSCTDGIGERLCRFIFESLFKDKFPKVRPDFLRNEISGRNLELDGYSDKLKIAFEYNGEQHYIDNSYYSKSKYDLQKIQKCKENNIALFSIKSISSVIKYKEIISEILEQAKQYNISVEINEININELYRTSTSESYLKEIKNIAISKGGKCLSNNYLDINSKLKFKCGKCLYIWQATANSIKNGNWCPYCANKIKSIDDAILLATNKNGKCISTNYTNSIDKMKWECHFKHQWEASYNQIQSGSWCPFCFKQNRSKKRIDITDYQKAAELKNGICLSSDLNSCYDKLEWKCQYNHTWFARADMIKNTKQWCPKCFIINKRKK